VNTRVSIITVARNSGATIKDACDSVARQTWPFIEHILIDGASSDDTVAAARQAARPDMRIVSEPDHGIYDAMNKGIRLATGDIIGFLNADDFYADVDAVAHIAGAIDATAADCCYGDIEYVAKDNTHQVKRRWKSRPYDAGLFEKGWGPPHPSFFARSNIFERYGMFDTSFRISGDYELMLRFMRRFGIRSTYVPKVIARMRTGGVSGRNVVQISKANWECYRAWRINGLSISPVIMLRKPLSKVVQYVTWNSGKSW